jgi:hypothetical protein
MHEGIRRTAGFGQQVAAEQFFEDCAQLRRLEIFGLLQVFSQKKVLMPFLADISLDALLSTFP